MLRKMKKGFTIIELMVTLSVVCIFLSYSLMSVKGYTDISNDIDVNYTDNKIVNFINTSRQYCKINNIKGRIYFIPDQNEIWFLSNSQYSKRFYLPEGFTLNPINLSTGNITIDARGFTANACTIKFSDRKDKMHSLTICVGTAYDTKWTSNLKHWYHSFRNVSLICLFLLSHIISFRMELNRIRFSSIDLHLLYNLLKFLTWS